MKTSDFTLTKKFLKNLVYNINGAAIEVHKTLGPGLLESVYHKCLEKEFSLRGIKYQSELKIPFDYKGYDVSVDLRCDFLIEDLIVLELKAVEYVLPIHEAQLITYMRLLDKPEGVMINFNVTNLYHEGQKTYVNNLFSYLPD